jgi:hypothetical protein
MFKNKKKKILIISGIILGVFLVLWGISLLFNTTTGNQTSTTNNQNTTGTNFFSNLFPFINTISNTAEKVLDVLGISDTQPQPEQTSLLKKITDKPVAGAGIFYQERFAEVPEVTPAPTTETANETSTSAVVTPTTETIPVIKYTEQTTGNVYQIEIKNTEEKTISSSTIPAVHDSIFTNNGNSVVMRYLQNSNTIESFVKNLPKEILGGDTVENLQNPGYFMPENISDLSASPDGFQLFYLLNTQNGSTGIISTMDGINKHQVFNSPFTEWLTQWPNDRMITLTTKASAELPSYMYAIDPNKQDFSRILGGVNGMTTLTSPNGRLVLYNTNDLSLYLYDIETKNAKKLNIKTLPEKCVWSNTSDSLYCAVPKSIPRGEYPDSWYQGEVSFSDTFWYVDIYGTNATMVFDPSDELKGEANSIDAIKLNTDANQEYLIFINKKDSSLWLFNL